MKVRNRQMANLFLGKNWRVKGNVHLRFLEVPLNERVKRTVSFKTLPGLWHEWAEISTEIDSSESTMWYY